jgi:hypothetical protein
MSRALSTNIWRTAFPDLPLFPKEPYERALSRTLIDYRNGRFTTNLYRLLMEQDDSRRQLIAEAAVQDWNWADEFLARAGYEGGFYSAASAWPSCRMRPSFSATGSTRTSGISMSRHRWRARCSSAGEFRLALPPALSVVEKSIKINQRRTRCGGDPVPSRPPLDRLDGAVHGPRAGSLQGVLESLIGPLEARVG